MSENPSDKNAPERSSEKDADNSVEVDQLAQQIQRVVKELDRLRASQNRTRKDVRRELHRISPTTSESEQLQISAIIRQLRQDEASYGEAISELEKQLSDLWARRRLLENSPLPERTLSPDEAEEQRLRWMLLDIKSQQMDVAEKYHLAKDPDELSRYQERFDQLREQYNSAYERLNQIRAARDKPQ